MRLEDEYFKKKYPDENQLIAYGFHLLDNIYYYEKELIEGFTAKLTIDLNGHVDGKVVDDAFDEEYIAFRVSVSLGDFSSKIKSEYEALLEDVADKCFIQTPFDSDQANEITLYIMSKYGVVPEFPWDEDNGTFKHPANQKWFGIIMSIDRSKLGEGSGTVEVINLKLEPEVINQLVEQNGFYRAYHMNKKYWITLVLDGTLDFSVISHYVDESYQIVSPKNKYDTNEWMVPANPSYFDVKAAFEDNPVIFWKQAASMKVGDIVYIYMGKPISAIQFKCQIIQTNIIYNEKNRLMKIRYLKEYEKNQISYDILKSYQTTFIRGPRHIPKDLSLYIHSLDKSSH